MKLKGKKYVDIAMWIVIGLNILIGVLFLFAGELGSGFKALVRIGLNLWIFKNIHKGKKWARVTIGILFTLGGITGLFIMLASASVTSLVISVTYLTLGIMMFRSKAIKEYLRVQREEQLFGSN